MYLNRYAGTTHAVAEVYRCFYYVPIIVKAVLEKVNMDLIEPIEAPGQKFSWAVIADSQ